MILLTNLYNDYINSPKINEQKTHLSSWFLPQQCESKNKISQCRNLREKKLRGGSCNESNLFSMKGEQTHKKFKMKNNSASRIVSYRQKNLYCF